MINILFCGNYKVFDGALTELISITNMYEEQGLSREEAQIEAFYECTGNK